MESATLFSTLCRLNHQSSNPGQIAHFEQGATDLESSVIAPHLSLEQRDALCRVFEAASRSDDAHVVPHEPPQFLPVVLNDHSLVRVPDSAVIPGDGAGMLRDEGLRDLLSCRLRVDKALQ